LRVDERAADDGAEHDGGNGGALHPAVGDDELSGGSSSVRMPYLAGEYMRRTDADNGIAKRGCRPASMMRQPVNLTCWQSA